MQPAERITVKGLGVGKDLLTRFGCKGLGVDQDLLTRLGCQRIGVGSELLSRFGCKGVGDGKGFVNQVDLFSRCGCKMIYTVDTGAVVNGTVAKKSFPRFD